MYKKTILIIISICCNLHFTQGQETFKLSGKVVDINTKQPLPYASVGILGKPKATVTNLQGEFDLYLPDTYKSEVLIISTLGYKNYRVPVLQLIQNKTNSIVFFELEESPKVLKEILISDSLSGRDILNIAINKIEVNYPTQPYVMDGFYRDIKKVNGKYVSLLESAIQIFDHGFSEPKNKKRLHEKVKLVEVRKSLGYNYHAQEYFNQKNLLEGILLRNLIRYQDFSFLKNTSTINRVKSTYYNDQKVYLITAIDQEEIFDFFINTKTFGILKINIQNTVPNKIKMRQLDARNSKLLMTVNFKKYGDKYYLNLITSNIKSLWTYKNSNRVASTTELFQMLLINNVEPDTDKRIRGTEKMKKFGLQYQDRPYNPAFWKTYNIIKETPLDKKIVSDLESELSLEEQFEQFQDKIEYKK